MSILLKFDYAKFDVSNLFFSEVIEEKPLGVGSTPLPPPPLVKEGLKYSNLSFKIRVIFCVNLDRACNLLHIFSCRNLAEALGIEDPTASHFSSVTFSEFLIEEAK